MSTFVCPDCGTECPDHVAHPHEDCYKTLIIVRKRLMAAVDGALDKVSLVVRERDEAKRTLADLLAMVPAQTTPIAIAKLERARAVLSRAGAGRTMRNPKDA